MRRSALILICLGSAFLTLAPLVRFYMAEELIAAPMDRYTVTTLRSENSTYFDTATQKHRRGATLEAVNTVRGDTQGAESYPDDVAVWESTTHIFDRARPKKADEPILTQEFRIAFDRRTSELVNCCGIHADKDGNVHMSGYGLLFPLSGVEKRDYPVYDMTTKQVVPMRFGAVERVHGLTTYRYTQTVPLTKTKAMDQKLTGDMLGMPPGTPMQDVDQYSEAFNTVWVDPRTGVPVKHRKNIRSSVRTPDGQGQMVTAQVDLVTTEADQKEMVDLANGTALQMNALRIYIPAGAVLLGLIGLLIGGILGLRRVEAPPPPPKAPRRGDGKFGDVPVPPSPGKKQPGKKQPGKKQPGKRPAGKQPAGKQPAKARAASPARRLRPPAPKRRPARRS